MSDSNNKILLFGSFTEGETRSLLNNKSSKDAVKPVLNNEVQTRSLNVVTGKSSIGPTEKVSKQADSRVGATQSFNPPKAGKPVQQAKIAVKPLPEGPYNNKQNGSIGNSSRSSPLNNGFKESKCVPVESTPASVSVNEFVPTNKFSILDLNGVDDGMLKHKDLNGKLDGSAVSIHAKGVTPGFSNGSVGASKIILPRGLINSGNLCFLNATLQALLSCSPFVQLLQDLRNQDIHKVGYPTLTAFTEFVSNFDMPAQLSMKKKDPTILETGRPFRPSMFENVLKDFTPDVANSISGMPRQEDAQEFLSFVMDKMHDELLKLEGHVSNLNGGNTSQLSSAEDDEWETVGPKNKSAVTRTQSFTPSELSAIFGGQLKSVVKAIGNKDSATIQPYLLLHLDILPDAVRNVEDALRLFSAPETLEGYRASATGKPGVVAARKSMKIQTLSKIMILHLMRFSYGTQGSAKLHKPVRFPLELVLGRELLVSPSTEGRKYELVATITHHGREPSKGHYTADVRHADGKWLRTDDGSVDGISANKVLHDQAYVLFYKQV